MHLQIDWHYKALVWGNVLTQKEKNIYNVMCQTLKNNEWMQLWIKYSIEERINREKNIFFPR